MTDLMGKTWDVFVSFAGRDEARAKTLVDLLDDQGLEVFCSNYSLEPGDRWPECIPQALEGSKVVAVLLSEYSGQARYQRAEIELAIGLEKDSRIIVVPVYLDGFPTQAATWEFGLRGYNHLDLHRDGPELTAEKLAGRFVKRQPEASKQAESLAHHTCGEIFYNASLKIDRTNQWAPMVEICAGDQSALFLLHGPRKQNLDLFVGRIWHYLAQECPHHHRPYVVPLQVQYTKPRTAAGWEIHLREGLGGGNGTTEDLLREVARSAPVFLVLSRFPIGAGVLDEAEQDALGEFLDDRLPRLIRSASEGGHPIRALLAAHYDGDQEPLVDALDARALAGCRRHGLVYRKLPPVKALGWEDVEHFLDSLDLRPPRRVYAKLKGAFERLGHGDLEFREVIQLLEQELF